MWLFCSSSARLGLSSFWEHLDLQTVSLDLFLELLKLLELREPKLPPEARLREPRSSTPIIG